ncbi:MAG: type II secretion system protein [Patescibacteria group bacterium]
MNYSMKKGFTLIEILIVVTIIGILASVVLVGLGPSRNRALDVRRQTELRQVQNALELYFNAQGQYPIYAGSSVEANYVNMKAQILASGIGINNLPNDPRAVNSPGVDDYGYQGDGTVYVLSARLDTTFPPGYSDPSANITNFPVGYCDSAMTGARFCVSN